MRNVVLSILALLLLLIVLPPLFLVEKSVPLDNSSPISPDGGIEVTLHINSTGDSLNLPLEEYLVGVVAAEMPASFHSEALKAQAVVARTYAVDHLRVFGGEGCLGGKADLCSDPQINQGWISEGEMKEKWGWLGYWRLKPKIERAVESTKGLIITYQGEPIEALYHAAAGSRTTAAQYVWGNKVPYLQSVTSPYEDHSPYNAVEVSYTVEELADRLDLKAEALKREIERDGSLFSQGRRSPSGRILEVAIAGQTFEGSQLRRLLGLNSARFEWSMEADRIVLTTKGYGHGVGMSQYGADGFAQEGYDFREIIKHYYPGAHIKPIFSE